MPPAAIIVTRVDDEDQDGHVEIGIDKGAYRVVTDIEVGSAAETKIDRNQAFNPAPCAIATAKDQSPQLCRWSRQHPRMASVDETEDAEPDDQKTRRRSGSVAAIGRGRLAERREGSHHEHGQQMADH